MDVTPPLTLLNPDPTRAVGQFVKHLTANVTVGCVSFDSEEYRVLDGQVFGERDTLIITAHTDRFTLHVRKPVHSRRITVKENSFVFSNRTYPLEKLPRAFRRPGVWTIRPCGPGRLRRMKAVYADIVIKGGLDIFLDLAAYMALRAIDSGMDKERRYDLFYLYALDAVQDIKEKLPKFLAAHDAKGLPKELAVPGLGVYSLLESWAISVLVDGMENRYLARAEKDYKSPIPVDFFGRRATRTEVEEDENPDVAGL